MKRRNNYNGKYYVISNPKLENLHTGNFSVAPWCIKNFDKDFLFEWRNPKTGILETKVLSKEYVKSHRKYVEKKIEDENGNIKLTYFYLISYKDIKAY